MLVTALLLAMVPVLAMLTATISDYEWLVIFTNANVTTDEYVMKMVIKVTKMMIAVSITVIIAWIVARIVAVKEDTCRRSQPPAAVLPVPGIPVLVPDAIPSAPPLPQSFDTCTVPPQQHAGGHIVTGNYNTITTSIHHAEDSRIPQHEIDASMRSMHELSYK